MNELALANFSDSTPLTIEASDATITMSVNDVLNLIAPDAPRTEAFKFLVKCRSLRLNPFADEVFLVPMGGGRWGTIIAKAGYLKRAQESELYAGFEAGIVIQKILNAQKGEFGETKEIEGACLPKGWIVIGGWCRVYRCGVARPFYQSIGSEYYKGHSDAWKNNTPTMYRKVAVAQAHREAFAIGDSYDESESPEPLAPMAARPVTTSGVTTIEATAEVEPARPPATPANPSTLPATIPMAPETHSRLIALMTAAELTPEETADMLRRRGAKSIDDLDEFAAQSCIRGLEALTDRFPFEAGPLSSAPTTEPDDSLAANPEDAGPADSAESFVAGNAARREPRKPRKARAEATEGAPVETVS